MTRNLPLLPISTCIYFALIGPLLAAQAANTDTANPPATESDMAAVKAADVCRNDLKTFTSQMEKDGYWVAGEGYSLGYPMGAAGFGMYGGMYSESGVQGRPAFAGPGFSNGRPGYEVRVLIASANILARHGQQQPCEDVLAATRGLYKSYLSDMQKDGVPPVDMPGWRQREIAAAVPVTGSKVAFRSDELLGVEVRSPDGVALGSVDDLALNPETGKLGYLVIARGGIFGFGETRIPIPWDDFKAAPNATLLVLDTTKSVLDGAPKVEKNSFSISGEAGSESQKVDAYWKANQPAKAGP
jgi:sporulation protein YlmC with PRC-barrel domain